MAKNIIAGIDVGSTNTRVLVAEYAKKDYPPVVLAAVKKPSRGLRHGYVVNAEETAAVIREVLAEAERIVGAKIKSAVLATGGVSLGTVTNSVTVAISRADEEVSPLDVDRAVAASERSVGEKPNTKVLHTIPLEYKLDGKKLLGKPHGMHGKKLEVKSLVITAQSGHLNELLSAVEDSGVEVLEVVASPFAESYSVASTLQKNAGCVIANIGAETVTLITYEEGLPISLLVAPIGSNDITKDIALGLKIPLEEAESLKVGRKEETKQIVKKVEEIAQARLSDIFEIIETHLKRIGRNGLLPAGIIFTGAGAELAGVVEGAKDYLNIPARIGENTTDYLYSGKAVVRKDTVGQIKYTGMTERIKAPEWSVAYGLTLISGNEESEESLGISIAKNTKGKLFNFIRQFLP